MRTIVGIRIKDRKSNTTKITIKESKTSSISMPSETIWEGQRISRNKEEIKEGEDRKKDKIWREKER